MAENAPESPPTLAGRLRRVASLVLIMALIVAGIIWLQGGDPIGSLRAVVSGEALIALFDRSPAPRPGRYAPDFSLTDLDGNQVTLSEHRGKKVILNFWATWCPPCRAEMPDLERLAHDHQGTLTVLLIDLEEGEEQIRPFLDDIGVTLVPLLDSDAAVATMYRVAALPTSLIIDEEGVIQEVQAGAVTYEWFVERLE